MRGYDKYIGEDIVNTQYHVAECSICGLKKWNYSGDWNFGTHICEQGYYNCGKTTTTIDIYTLSCGKDETTVESVTIIY